MAAQPTDSGVPTETPESGHSLRAIAAAVGVSKSTVARDFRGVDQSTVRTSRGLDGKEYASPSARERRRLLHRALRAQGVSERIIAEQTGWSQPTVHRDLQDVVTVDPETARDMLAGGEWSHDEPSDPRGVSD